MSPSQKAQYSEGSLRAPRPDRRGTVALRRFHTRPIQGGATTNPAPDAPPWGGAPGGAQNRPPPPAPFRPTCTAAPAVRGPPKIARPASPAGRPAVAPHPFVLKEREE